MKLCDLRIGIVFVAVISVVLFTPLKAGIIPDVPASLPDPPRSSLNETHARLQSDLDKINKRVDRFNAACNSVEAKSADSCRTEQQVIRGKKDQLLKDVALFKQELRVAGRAEPKPTPGSVVRNLAQDSNAARLGQGQLNSWAKPAESSSQVTRLQNQFRSLSEEIDLDRQVVRNFGFEKTIDEIEYWGSLPTRQVEEAKSAFKTMLFDATLVSVSEAAGAVGSLTSEEVDAMNRLAAAQGAPPLGIVAGANDVHRALEFLDKTKGAYEATDAFRKKQMLDAAVGLGGLASKNPAFGLLLTADRWAAYQVYQSVNAVKTVHDLTNANEGDLILLKSRSEKLKNEVNQLAHVKKQLVELSGKNDSTKLVKKPD